jgi:hypothetical protein
LALEAGDMLDYRFADDVAAEIMVETMAAAGYDVVALGDQEFAGGEEFFLNKIVRSKLPLVALNVYGPGGRVAPPWAVFDLGAVRIGVTAALEPGLMAYYAPSDKISVRPYERELREAIAQLGRDADVVIVVGHMPAGEARRLAAEFGGVDIIIAGHDQQDLAEDPIVVGDTYIVSAGPRGMAAGTVGIIKRDGAVAFEFGKILLDEGVPKDEGLNVLVEQYYDNLYAGLARNRASWLERQIDERGVLVRDNLICARCHDEQYEDWETSAHASAYGALVEKGRAGSPACLYCHTTYYGVAAAFGDAGGPNLEFANVGCISCHTVREGHPAAATADDVNELTCLPCHNRDFSPDFVYSSALEEIRHR